MGISRRNLIKTGLAAGAVLSAPTLLRAQTAPIAARTVRMVMQSDLQVFDPIYSTAAITYNHGLAIYDTLFAVDSKLMPRPQMVGRWGVSDENKTYTFELREGLAFHDGSPVTAADCVASIRRWAETAEGKLIMEQGAEISKKDDRTFTIALKEPFALLIDMLAKPGSILAIMREKDADRPATEQVTSNIGSGPFKFNKALAKPGASFTYDRNEQYVPRQEAPDGYAGGKVVNVERVIWEQIGDQQTAFAALQAGEIEFIESPSTDLVPVIESDPNLKLQVLNNVGSDLFLRMNCLQKPFDNVKARQAMLHLIDQEAVMRAAIGNPNYFKVVTSLFGNRTPYSNDENTGWYKKGGDPERAKQLFKEAGYAGEKVVILDPTNFTIIDSAAQYLVAELRKIGINAELAPSDWGGVVARRANKGPVADGGWSILISYWNVAGRDPVDSSFLLANGEEGWFGWPKNDEYETLRAKWVYASFEERKALARKMQGLWWDFVGCVMLGEFVSPSVRRKSLVDLVTAPSSSVQMWNMRKVSA